MNYTTYFFYFFKFTWSIFKVEALKSSDIQAHPSDRDSIQQDQSSNVNSGRRFQVVASFRLVWWNQGSKSRTKLSIWRPILPQQVVQFVDIAVRECTPFYCIYQHMALLCHSCLFFDVYTVL
ncbi:uncharacterized protein [Rutidosis leptorrhynchoides]|uniref:uncharacterized protein n=1 Tax=Rutidosis leptorrhynchoides TaxID=125765 RepID=UPI003A99F200